MERSPGIDVDIFVYTAVEKRLECVRISNAKARMSNECRSSNDEFDFGLHLSFGFDLNFGF
jgi:hypothetical protein